MGFMGDVAAAWLNDEDREETDQASAEQKHQAKAKKVAEHDDAEEAEEFVSDEVAAELTEDLRKMLDGAAIYVGGTVYAQSDMDAVVFRETVTPVMKKYAPVDGLDGLKNRIPVEWVMLGGLAFIYVPKYWAAEKAAKEAATSNGASSSPSNGEKEVAGEVTNRVGLRAVP